MNMNDIKFLLFLSFILFIHGCASERIIRQLNTTKIQYVNRCGDSDAPYVCLGSYHYHDCNFDKIVDCFDIKYHRDAICLPDLADSELACWDPLPLCNAPGKFKFDPEVCSHFYECVEKGTGIFELIMQSCSPGYEFSERDKGCVKAEDAGCSIPYPYIDVTKDPICKKLGDRQPSKISCHQYFECTKFLFYNRRFCPNDKPYYNAETKNCSFIPNCDSRPHDLVVTKPKPSCKEGEKRADPLNCRKYYLCFFHREIAQECVGTTAFSKDEGKCVDNTNNKICA